MISQTKYNDFKGTISADFADSKDSLQVESILKLNKIDIEKYQPFGFEFFSGTNNYFRFSILCIDKENSTTENNFVTRFNLGSDFTIEDFFKLFKRFHGIIANNRPQIEFEEINENIDLFE